jgi:Rrf2 family protein
MSRIVQLSEAATIGLHSMVVIARAGELINVSNIAEQTGASRNHLAKVMQRLVKAGFVKSNRGPSGGFVLKKKAKEITVLQIYEAIEGKIETDGCPMDQQVCPFNKCLIGGIVKNVSEDFIKYIKKTTLQDYI